MLETGVRTTLLSSAVLADEVLVNRDGGTKRVGIEAFVAQLIETGVLGELVTEFSRLLTFPAWADAEAAIIPSETSAIRILGRDEPGDGGAAYLYRVEVEPTHPGKLESADGAFWELTPEQGVGPRMFGADDDDAAWADLATYINAMWIAGRWRSGFNIAPDIVDGRGRTFALTSVVHILPGIHLHNVKIRILDGGSLKITEDIAGGTNLRRVALTSVDMIYEGEANSDLPMLDIPKCSHSVIDETCTFNAGLGDYRARYGVWLGRHKGFGCSVTGSFRGGECCIRLGMNSDLTSLVFEPQICAQGRKYDAIICNPKGARIKGDFEHAAAEDGASQSVALGIVSEGDGSAHIAEAFTLSCGYAFNNGHVPDGTSDSDGKVAFSIGKDLPGTEGWDDPGQPTVPITSGNGMESFSIEDMYVTSNHVEIFFDIRCRGYARMSRITWGGTPTGSNPQALARFDGPCTEFRLDSCRNQNTGLKRPIWYSSATNPILWSEGPNTNYTPTLYGETTPGSITFDARGCRYTIGDNVVFMDMFWAWSARSGGAGRLVVDLPPNMAPRAGTRGVVEVYSGGLTLGPAQAIIFPGAAKIVITGQNTGTDLEFSHLPVAGNLHLKAVFEADFSTPEPV